MKRILIDIGNTRTKLVLSEPDGFTLRAQIPSKELTEASVALATEAWNHDVAVLCSVVPARNEAIRAVFGKQLLEVRHTTPLGIGIDYPAPASIGPDRLANAAGLARLYGCPGIAIDFGTAVTFDIVSPEKNYVGGVIAPGVEMMNDYMSERTALLPRVELIANPPAIGRTTEQAMQSGAYYGYLGMIREILDQVLRTFSSPDEVTIVATGGISTLFAHGLPLVRYTEPDLTLLGLKFIAETNGL